MDDVVVIGAGINGLLLCRELAEAGCTVTLLDKGRACSEASWAGGGIVSPLYPWRYRQPITALATWAQTFYPELASALQESTGIDPELTVTGLLMLEAMDEEAALHWAQENNRPMQPVDGAFIRAREPALADGFLRGLWMPDVANIRNPRLGKALVADLAKRRGVTLYEQCEFTGFDQDRTRSVIRSAKAILNGNTVTFSAEKFVLCTGAWSGVLTQMLGAVLPVEPVKGQMLLYRCPEPPVRAIVLTDGRYVIPRRDGYVLVGSTLEFAGFDKTPTEPARYSLSRAGEKLLPCLKNLAPVRQWAGLRPGAPEGIPFIGQMPGFVNLYVNAGQFRNGLVLAPASARLAADLLLGREAILDPGPYRPRVSTMDKPPYSRPSFFSR